ncbi:angiotensin-converting enzyme-like [Eurosta solidaginis]|uniref:angiotensin-converting enzyme-like n=1 Tax=Eurosta solidaginis TaxID=178769 RepID=UPI003530E230
MASDFEHWVLSTLLLTTFICLAQSAENYTFPNDPEYFNEEGAQRLLNRVNDVYWASATVYRQYADDTLSPEILMREKLRPFYETMQKFDWRNFVDPLLRRQFEVILRGAKYPPIDYKFKRATNTLKNMSRKKWVCNKNELTNCQMAFVHQIKSVFTNSDDLDELKYYWKEWRNKMPTDVKEALHYYISYYKNLSTADMAPSAFWYDQYEDPDLLYELENLMKAIRPFYREMHAHLRNVLRHKYGNDVIPPTGLIPHHLLEQVTYQAWKKETVLKNPFPQRKLPNLQTELDGVGLKPFDLVNISVQFFSSMGFRNFTEEFMSEHFIEMEPGTGGPDCKSRIFDFGEIELHYCPRVYYKKLLQTHADITAVQYAIAKNNFRVGLNQEACPGFGAALGEAVILSVSNPKHLQQRLGLLQNYEYDDILNLNRLYRMAAHTLLTLPTYFVHEKLWVDIIDGKVPPEHYNCHYWNLMQKYMGVEPPLQTDPGVYDMPYKFYEGIVDQHRSTKKIFDEFLGYQIYRVICLNIGEFERRNAYKPLDNCDFYGNKFAGKFLYDMMSSGSSKPWREVIKPLTWIHATNMTATAFLEYFEPLNTWISDDNINKNLRVGWMPIDKCKLGIVPPNATTVVY